MSVTNTFRAIAVGIVLFGGVVMYAAFGNSKFEQTMLVEGVDVDARVIKAEVTKSRSRRGPPNYHHHLTLAWKDTAGNTRKFQRTVSRGVFDLVVKDQKIILPTVTIRYLPSYPQARPAMALEQTGFPVGQAICGILMVALGLVASWFAWAPPSGFNLGRLLGET